MAQRGAMLPPTIKQEATAHLAAMMSPPAPAPAAPAAPAGVRVKRELPVGAQDLADLALPPPKRPRAGEAGAAAPNPLAHFAHAALEQSKQTHTQKRSYTKHTRKSWEQLKGDEQLKRYCDIHGTELGNVGKVVGPDGDLKRQRTELREWVRLTGASAKCALRLTVDGGQKVRTPADFAREPAGAGAGAAAAAPARPLSASRCCVRHPAAHRLRKTACCTPTTACEKRD